MKYPLKILLIIGVFVAVLLFAARVRLGNSEIIYAEPIDTSDAMLLAQVTAVPDATAIPDSADAPPKKPIQIDVPAPPKPTKPVSVHPSVMTVKRESLNPVNDSIKVYKTKGKIVMSPDGNYTIIPGKTIEVPIRDKFIYENRNDKKLTPSQIDSVKQNSIVLPDIKTVADSILTIPEVDSVEIFDTIAIKVYITKENFIKRYGEHALEMRGGKYPGYVWYEYKRRPLSNATPEERATEKARAESLAEKEIYGDFDPATEIVERRTATARHFRNPDGSVTAIIKAGCAQCEALDGDSNEDGLRRAMDAYENTTNAYDNSYWYGGVDNTEYWSSYYCPGYWGPWADGDYGGTYYYDCAVGSETDYADEYYRSAIDWDISSIPPTSIIDNTELMVYVEADNYDEFDANDVYVDVYNMYYACWHRDEAWEQFYDCGDGTKYYDSWYLQCTGTGHYVGYIDLGPAADSDLESQLSQGWFSVGMRNHDDESSSDRGVLIDGRYCYLRVTYHEGACGECARYRLIIYGHYTNDEESWGEEWTYDHWAEPPHTPRYRWYVKDDHDSNPDECDWRDEGCPHTMIDYYHYDGRLSDVRFDWQLWEDDGGDRDEFDDGDDMYANWTHNIEYSTMPYATWYTNDYCNYSDEFFGIKYSYRKDNLSPSLSNDPSASPNPVCAGGSVTLSISGGSSPGDSWNYYWYNGNNCGGTSIGSGSSITVYPEATQYYSVRTELTDHRKCYSDCKSIEIIVYNSEPVGTWTGYEDTDWHNPKNWGHCQVPNNTVDVKIPTEPSGGRWPHIMNGYAECKTLTIHAGANLYIDSGLNYLYVYGDIINNGTIHGNGDYDNDITMAADATYSGSGTWTAGGFCVAGNVGNYTCTLGSDVTLYDLFTPRNWGTGSENAVGTFTTNNYTVTLHSIFNSGVINCGSSTINISGDYSWWGWDGGAGVFNANTSTVIFNGSGTSYIYDSPTFYNLTIDKTGSGKVILGSNISVAGDVDVSATGATDGSSGGIELGDYEINMEP